MCLPVCSLEGFLTPIAKGHWQDLNFEHSKNHHLIVATYLLVECSGHEIHVHVHGHKIKVHKCYSVSAAPCDLKYSRCCMALSISQNTFSPSNVDCLYSTIEMMLLHAGRRFIFIIHSYMYFLLLLAVTLTTDQATNVGFAATIERHTCTDVVGHIIDSVDWGISL